MATRFGIAPRRGSLGAASTSCARTRPVGPLRHASAALYLGPADFGHLAMVDRFRSGANRGSGEPVQRGQGRGFHEPPSPESVVVGRRERHPSSTEIPRSTSRVDNLSRWSPPLRRAVLNRQAVASLTARVCAAPALGVSTPSKSVGRHAPTRSSECWSTNRPRSTFVLATRLLMACRSEARG